MTQRGPSMKVSPIVTTHEPMPVSWVHYRGMMGELQYATKLNDMLYAFPVNDIPAGKPSSVQYRAGVVQALLNGFPLNTSPIAMWVNPDPRLVRSLYRPGLKHLRAPLYECAKDRIPALVVGGIPLFLTILHLEEWDDLIVDYRVKADGIVRVHPFFDVPPIAENHVQLSLKALCRAEIEQGPQAQRQLYARMRDAKIPLQKVEIRFERGQHPFLAQMVENHRLASLGY